MTKTYQLTSICIHYGYEFVVRKKQSCNELLCWYYAIIKGTDLFDLIDDKQYKI